MTTPTRPQPPDRFKKLYHHYIDKAWRLEQEVNALADTLKEKYAFDHAGNARNKADVDKMIGDNKQYKDLVGDQQFAERHANMYGPGYVAEALRELNATMVEIGRMLSMTPMERSVQKLWPIEGKNPPKEPQGTPLHGRHLGC